MSDYQLMDQYQRVMAQLSGELGEAALETAISEAAELAKNPSLSYPLRLTITSKLERLKMDTLTVNTATVIKQSTAQSSTLPPSAKGTLNPGNYPIVKVEPAPLGHLKVSFAQRLGAMDGVSTFQTWLVYADSAIEVPGIEQAAAIELGVTWDSQINSRYPDQAYRMCFSSSIWIALGFVSEAFKKRFPKDDDYLAYMLDFGDTTDASAHIAALKKAGFEAQYSTKGSLETIIKSLSNGLPCCLGILHHGSVKYPSGGGHWICCGGVNAQRTKFKIFDPYGSVIDDPPYSGPVERGNGYWIDQYVLDGRWTVSTKDSDGWMMTFYQN